MKAASSVFVLALLLSVVPFAMRAPTARAQGGTWGTPERIGPDFSLGFARGPQVAVDPAGNAFAVWAESDNGTYNIWANRYVAGVGWETAVLLETDDRGDAEYPQVAVDATGDAFAVWEQSNGSLYSIYANRYAAGVGWGTAELLETSSAGNAGWAHVAASPAGDAFAVWEQYDGARWSIDANRYARGTGWGTAVPIETNDIGYDNLPEVAADASGDAIAVWEHSDTVRQYVWANRYVAGTGWGTAEQIQNDGVEYAQLAKVGVAANGDAIAAWRGRGLTGLSWNISVSRYVVGTGWGATEVVATSDVGTADDPHLAVGPSGDAMVAWAWYDGARWHIQGSGYTPGAGWEAAGLVEVLPGNATAPAVAMDAAGDATVAWLQVVAPSRTSIGGNRHVPGTGWGTAGMVETVDGNAGGRTSPPIRPAT